MIPMTSTSNLAVLSSGSYPELAGFWGDVWGAAKKVGVGVVKVAAGAVKGAVVGGAKAVVGGSGGGARAAELAAMVAQRDAEPEIAGIPVKYVYIAGAAVAVYLMVRK